MECQDKKAKQRKSREYLNSTLDEIERHNSSVGCAATENSTETAQEVILAASIFTAVFVFT